ncbi:MAG: PAS domain-containing protein, partial [bacterium]
MSDEQKRSDLARELRKAAEEKARSLEMQELEALSPEETRQMLHELRVHQIELEMQNEELRRAQEELNISRARYFDLYDLVPVGYCTLSEKGLILEANLAAATLLGVSRGALVKQLISRFI